MIKKLNFFKKFKKAKQEKQTKQLQFHSAPEPSYNITYRLPTVGDTTCPYNYEQILNLFYEAENYAEQVLKSGVKADEKNGAFLDQTITVKCLIEKALLIECRERHNNARISIQEELKAKKREQEFELQELIETYKKLKEEI